mmetsp:Transcript_7630/g.14495  ORF Transcript_7630/g.14495 Transcript_7630/m.14495 type:complete len:286 (+) Transcript_7630:291-1148(+)
MMIVSTATMHLAPQVPLCLLLDRHPRALSHLKRDHLRHSSRRVVTTRPHTASTPTTTDPSVHPVANLSLQSLRMSVSRDVQLDSKILRTLLKRISEATNGTSRHQRKRSTRIVESTLKRTSPLQPVRKAAGISPALLLAVGAKLRFPSCSNEPRARVPKVAMEEASTLLRPCLLPIYVNTMAFAVAALLLGAPTTGAVTARARKALHLFRISSRIWTQPQQPVCTAGAPTMGLLLPIAETMDRFDLLRTVCEITVAPVKKGDEVVMKIRLNRTKTKQRKHGSLMR